MRILYQTTKGNGHLSHARSQRGFTLIELLLYIGISATLLLIISLFLGQLISARIKNQTIAEVDQQGMQVMQLMTQVIRNAKGINAPLPGVSAPSVMLDVAPVAANPTNFDLISGMIQVTEGLGPPVALTNARVIASALTFENLSRAGTPGVISTVFTLTHINPEGRAEYAYEKTFYGTASLR